MFIEMITKMTQITHVLTNTIFNFSIFEKIFQGYKRVIFVIFVITTFNGNGSKGVMVIKINKWVNGEWY
jgi:hypothetical protein